MKEIKPAGKKPSMTRKQALAVLYQLRDAYIEALSFEAFEEAQAFRSQVLDALIVLTRVHHGKPAIEQSVFLCGLCHLRYAEFYHEGKWSTIWPRLCPSCYQHLQAEDKLQEKLEVLS